MTFTINSLTYTYRVSETDLQTIYNFELSPNSKAKYGYNPSLYDYLREKMDFIMTVEFEFLNTTSDVSEVIQIEVAEAAIKNEPLPLIKEHIDGYLKMANDFSEAQKNKVIDANFVVGESYQRHLGVSYTVVAILPNYNAVAVNSDYTDATIFYRYQLLDGIVIKDETDN